MTSRSDAESAFRVPRPTHPSSAFPLEDDEIVVKDQIKNYKCEASLPLDVCPLTWWADNEVNYPFLADVAKDLLAAPGSTAALERASSHASRIWTKSMSRLDSELGSDILFAHENIQRGHF